MSRPCRLQPIHRGLVDKIFKLGVQSHTGAPGRISTNSVLKHQGTGRRLHARHSLSRFTPTRFKTWHKIPLHGGLDTRTVLLPLLATSTGDMADRLKNAVSRPLALGNMSWLHQATSPTHTETASLTIMFNVLQFLLN